MGKEKLLKSFHHLFSWVICLLLTGQQPTPLMRFITCVLLPTACSIYGLLNCLSNSGYPEDLKKKDTTNPWKPKLHIAVKGEKSNLRRQFLDMESGDARKGDLEGKPARWGTFCQGRTSLKRKVPKHQKKNYIHWVT